MYIRDCQVNLFSSNCIKILADFNMYVVKLYRCIYVLDETFAEMEDIYIRFLTTRIMRVVYVRKELLGELGI